MEIPKIHEGEYRFCLILWEHGPIAAAQLARLCQEQLGWKRTTTYTVIKRLGERGVLKNEDGMVTALVSKDEAQAWEIDELVETDPTAFYSYDEYETAAETLYQVVKLRGQSIQGQLDGTIPSTEEAQRDSDALVDASDLDVSVMGTMNMGGGDGKAPAKSQNESN